jgi:nucleolar complex protein 3
VKVSKEVRKIRVYKQVLVGGY